MLRERGSVHLSTYVGSCAALEQVTAGSAVLPANAQPLVGVVLHLALGSGADGRNSPGSLNTGDVGGMVQQTTPVAGCAAGRDGPGGDCRCRSNCGQQRGDGKVGRKHLVMEESVCLVVSNVSVESSE